MKVLIFIFSLFVSSQTLANYEPSVIWSGKHSALAGSGASYAEGAEALYFNPAGMVKTERSELSLNFSPSFYQFSGPISTANTTVAGSRPFAPVFGALYAGRVSQDFAAGLGIYVAGGQQAEYKDQTFGSLGTGTVSAKLSFIEAALGGAYDLGSGFRVGAAWRVTFVGAELNLADASSGSTLSSLQFKDLKQTKFNGFKFGFQYESESKNWGAGINWRTPIYFSTKGTLGGNVQSGGSVTATATDSDAFVNGSLPSSLHIGAHVAATDSLTLFGEYTWGQYSRNPSIGIDATFFGVNVSDVLLNWKDVHIYRIAANHAGLIAGWPIRLGYAMASAVSPKGTALPVSAPPGAAHFITFGTGTALAETVDLNLAFNYIFGSADVSASEITTGATTLAGNYKFNAYVVHSGVNFKL